MRSFPFGTAALCMLILSLATGLWIACTPTPPKQADLTFWTFTKIHYDPYTETIPHFEAAHHCKVDLQLVSNQAVTSRLQAALLSDVDVPDLVEIPIDNAPAFFRGPLEHVGFVDLTERIHKSGLWNRMVQARFAPYTSRGHIFGLPHDVHPVQIAYRSDIFEKEGVHANEIQTWDDFIRIGRQLTIPNHRYMIELFDFRAAHLEMCLFQRGGGYFDPQGNCIFDNETAVQTMLWFVPLVAGPHKIGASIGTGQILTQAVDDGYFLCLIAPDWRSKDIEKNIPLMAGKMKLMPLPALTRGGKHTSTWGGTMLGITKHCKNPELAWKLALHLYLNKTELGKRYEGTNILPALREAWSEPSFSKPRPYWSNQPIGSMYAKLAPQVPFQYTSPFIANAKSKLGEALVACVQYYNAHGEDGFEPFARVTLKAKADQIRALAARNPY